MRSTPRESPGVKMAGVRCTRNKTSPPPAPRPLVSARDVRAARGTGQQARPHSCVTRRSSFLRGYPLPRGSPERYAALGDSRVGAASTQPSASTIFVQTVPCLHACLRRAVHRHVCARERQPRYSSLPPARGAAALLSGCSRRVQTRWCARGTTGGGASAERVRGGSSFNNEYM